MPLPPTTLEKLLAGDQEYRNLSANPGLLAPSDTVIFIGAGTSIGPGLYPSWPELMKPFKEFLQVQKKAVPADALDLAEAVHKQSKKHYNEILKEHFSSPRSQIQTSLLQVEHFAPRFFINTNYDPSLAEALHLPLLSEPQSGNGARIFTFRDLPSSGSVPPRSCVHIHGFIEPGQSEDPDVILRRKDFEDNYIKDDKLPEFLKSVFRSFNVLFIGFSFGDSYINGLLKEILSEEIRAVRGRKSRYAFVPLSRVQGKIESLEFDYVSLRQFDELSKKYISLGITPLWYDPHENHHRVKEMLKKLNSKIAIDRKDSGPNHPWSDGEII